MDVSILWYMTGACVGLPKGYRIRNGYIKESRQVEDIDKMRKRWFDNVVRQGEEGSLVFDGRRCMGGPNLTWEKVVRTDMVELWEDQTLIKDRKGWKAANHQFDATIDGTKV